MGKLTTVKKVNNAILYRDENNNPLIRIDNVRASHPYVGTPSEDTNDDGKKSKKWRIVGMLPKKTHTEAKNLCKEVILEIIAANKGAKVPSDKWFLANGDDKEDEEMHGHFLITASDGRIRPRCRNAAGQIIDAIDEIDEKFYGGCWVSILIRPWFFDGKAKGSTKTYPKRVSAGLNSVMFVEDDKPFGSGRIDDGEVWGETDDGFSNDEDDDDL